MPVFSYTVNGAEYSAKADPSTKEGNQFAGAEGTMLVNPADPGMIRYGSTVGVLLADVVLALAGLLFIVLCFF